jgi:hypothetical protein
VDYEQLKTGDSVEFSVSSVKRVGLVLERVRANRLPRTVCGATLNARSKREPSIVVRTTASPKRIYWVNETCCCKLILGIIGKVSKPANPLAAIDAAMKSTSSRKEKASAPVKVKADTIAKPFSHTALAIPQAPVASSKGVVKATIATAKQKPSNRVGVAIAPTKVLSVAQSAILDAPVKRVASVENKDAKSEFEVNVTPSATKPKITLSKPLINATQKLTTSDVVAAISASLVALNDKVGDDKPNKKNVITDDLDDNVSTNEASNGTVVLTGSFRVQPKNPLPFSHNFSELFKYLKKHDLIAAEMPGPIKK